MDAVRNAVITIEIIAGPDKKLYSSAYPISAYSNTQKKKKSDSAAGLVTSLAAVGVGLAAIVFA